MNAPIFPEGRTVADGAFRVDKWIDGSCFSGTHVATGNRVHIAHLSSSTMSSDALRAALSYDVEGVAPCLFLGRLDGQERDAQTVMLVEGQPPGKCLFDLSAHALADQQRLDVVTELAKRIQRATRQRIVLAGLRPDLVFVDVNEAAIGVGIVPRSPAFVSTFPPGPHLGGFATPTIDRGTGPFGDPAMLNPARATTSGDVYCLGLLIAWLYEHKHPFTLAASADQGDYISAMENDKRDPFTGPAPIGRLLDRMLLADPGKRVLIDEAVIQLEAISPPR